MGKSVLILVALGVGLLWPGLEAYTFTLRPFLMVLLFFAFLDVRLDRSVFAVQQGYAAAVLPLMGTAVYLLGRLHSEDLGLTLFLMGLAPTAIITPVLAGLMRRRVAYLVGAILVTHAVFAVLVPLFLPALLGVTLSVAALAKLFFTIGSTVAGPLVGAQLLRRWGGRALTILRKLGTYSFALFISNITVAAGSLSHYLRHAEGVPWSFVVLTTATVGGLMLINFYLGSRLAPAGHRVEGSLALGRKNTMLSIWIALEYINPLVVLGPMLYILLQNVFVAGQIAVVERRDRRRRRLKPVPTKP